MNKIVAVIGIWCYFPKWLRTDKHFVKKVSYSKRFMNMLAKKGILKRLIVPQNIYMNEVYWIH